MKPVNFKQANKFLTKPEGWTDEECETLPVYNDGLVCISLWKMTWKERLSALIFGKVWLWVHSGKTQPPVALSAERQIFRTIPKDPACGDPEHLSCNCPPQKGPTK